MSTAAITAKEAQDKAIETSKAALSGFAGRAVEILQELAEFADNDRIRLSAVNSILDRAGVITPQTATMVVTAEEHALIKGEAEATMQRIRENAEQAALTRPKELDTIMVLEGEGDEVTPTT